MYTLAAFLDRFRPEVLRLSSCSGLLALLASLAEADQDTVLSHGLDVWELDGCPLLPGVYAAAGGGSAETTAAAGGGEAGAGIDNRLSREIKVM